MLKAGVAGGAAEAERVGQKLGAAVPLRGRQAKGKGAHQNLAVRAICDVDLPGKFTILIEGCDGLEAIDEGERRTGGSVFEAGVAGGRNDQGLLVPDGLNEHLERGDAWRGVGP